MLFEHCSKKLPIMLNIMPLTIVIMPENFIVFNNYISTVRLQSVAPEDTVLLILTYCVQIMLMRKVVPHFVSDYGLITILQKFPLRLF